MACVGLDPRLDQLPESIRGRVTSTTDLQATSDAYEIFCEGIVDVVKDLVPSREAPGSFFRAAWPGGDGCTRSVVKYASDAGLLVIMDAKRNDIGSTALGYAQERIWAPGDQSAWGSDSLTVSPYLGRDSIEPFVESVTTRRGDFRPRQNVESGGRMLQDRKTDGQTVL